MEGDMWDFLFYGYVFGAEGGFFIFGWVRGHGEPGNVGFVPGFRCYSWFFLTLLVLSETF